MTEHDRRQSSRPKMDPSSRVLVVIGSSGVGKSSVVNRLHGDGIIEVTPSWTTRPARSDELDGSLEHTFVDEENFIARRGEDYFLETVQLFGLPYWYGLPHIKTPAPGKVPLLMLRANLVPALRRHYPNYTVYQIEDSYERTMARLLDRQSEGHRLGTRLEDFRSETISGRVIADRVLENDKTIDDLAKRFTDALYSDGLL